MIFCFWQFLCVSGLERDELPGCDNCGTVIGLGGWDHHPSATVRLCHHAVARCKSPEFCCSKGVTSLQTVRLWIGKNLKISDLFLTYLPSRKTLGHFANGLVSVSQVDNRSTWGWEWSTMTEWSKGSDVHQAKPKVWFCWTLWTEC